jgi:hypothetical protein
MIIVCYDGSEDAQAAADQVIRLFPEKPATVLTVPEPHADTLMSSGLGLGSGFGLGYERSEATAELDAQRLERAKRTAEEGARRLRATGMGRFSSPRARRKHRENRARGGRARQRRGGRRRTARTRRS